MFNPRHQSTTTATSHRPHSPPPSPVSTNPFRRTLSVTHPSQYQQQQQQQTSPSSPYFYSSFTHNHPSPIDLDPFDGEDPFSVPASALDSPAPSMTSAQAIRNDAFSIPVAAMSSATPPPPPPMSSLASGGRGVPISPSLSATSSSGTTPPGPEATLTSSFVTTTSSAPRSLTPESSSAAAPLSSSDIRTLLQEDIPEGLPPAYSQLEPLPGTTFPVIITNNDTTQEQQQVVPPALPARTEPPAIPPRDQQQPSPQPQQQQQQSAAVAASEPEPVNEYVLKSVDWIDPATGIEKRIKIITQNRKYFFRYSLI